MWCEYCSVERELEKEGKAENRQSKIIFRRINIARINS